MGIAEGGPELRQLADVRCRRIDRIRELRLKRCPCNFVAIMSRLDEHLRRAKARGTTV
jgi:hypothetical protein